MPELPEVETIRRGLAKHIVGKAIVDIEILLPKIFRGDASLLNNATITEVRRFGKGLIIDTDNGYSLAVHVKMTGQLVYREGVPRVSKVSSVSRENSDYPNKWTHVSIKLKNPLDILGTPDTLDTLYFSDQRQFGWMQVVETSQLFELPFFKSLGPEPLRDLDEPMFQKIVSSSKAPIKSLLMNQQKIAGLGNIYVNDALYLAKIHPSRQSASLTPHETHNLFSAIETVLTRSLTVGGASAKNYVNVQGERGSYQDFFLVYGKDKTPCPTCGTPIQMMRIAGRSTFYCPTCQKQD